METLSRQVDGRDGLAPADVHVDPQVGARQVDRRAALEARPELVDDDVLSALCAEERVGHPDGRAEPGEIHGERAVRRQVRGPVDPAQSLPEGVGAAVERQARHPQQHTLGEPRPEAGAVAERQGAGERDAAVLLGDTRVAHTVIVRKRP